MRGVRKRCGFSSIGDFDTSEKCLLAAGNGIGVRISCGISSFLASGGDPRQQATAATSTFPAASTTSAAAATILPQQTAATEYTDPAGLTELGACCFPELLSALFLVPRPQKIIDVPVGYVWLHCKWHSRMDGAFRG